MSEFNVGDRVVYVGLDTRHNQPKKIGWRGVVVSNDGEINSAPSDMVLVRFDNHPHVHTLYLANVEKEPPNDTVRGKAVWLNGRWLPLAQINSKPREMVRGDLVSCSIHPQSPTPPKNGWGSIDNEYERIRVDLPPRYLVRDYTAGYAAQRSKVTELEGELAKWKEYASLTLEREIESLKGRAELAESRYASAQTMFQTVSNVSIERYKKIGELERTIERTIEQMHAAARVVRTTIDNLYQPTQSDGCGHP